MAAVRSSADLIPSETTITMGGNYKNNSHLKSLEIVLRAYGQVKKYLFKKM